MISIAKEQANCGDQFNEYQSFDVGAQEIQLHCNTNRPNPRPVLPVKLRHSIYDTFHNLSHPGWKATCRLVGSRYFWPTLKQDVKQWTSECQACQAAKVNRHTIRPLGELPCPTKRFTTVHLDLVGPLSDDKNLPRYLLTMIDAYTRWFECFPLTDITAERVCEAFLFQWVSRFGPPLNIITDRGKQFTSELMKNLNKNLGVHHIRCSSYNPKCNGIIERSHRTLKGGLKARGGKWLQQLPFVLIGMRMMPDESGSSAFSRVTGEQPMVPQILMQETTPAQITKKLEDVPHIYKIPRTKEKTSHIPEKLQQCSHVWLRLDRVRKPLEAPYQGPFKVMSRTDITITIEMRGKPVTVSIERVKPARLPTNKPQQVNNITMNKLQEDKKKIDLVVTFKEELITCV